MPNDQESGRAIAEGYTRLMSLAVHEFRTPVSVVSGYLRMLLIDAGGPLTDHQRRMIEEAEKSCERIVALISELGEIVRLDSGTAPGERKTFDLFDVVREVSRDTRDAEGRPVEVDVQGERSRADLRGDRTQLAAALSAIIHAIAREQGEAPRLAIDCRLTRENGDVEAVLTVARPADLEATHLAPRGVFDERQGGLGLALPIARRVIERHGGRVWTPAPAAPGASERRAGVVVSIPLT